MSLVSSRKQSNNHKLYFSKSEISKILNCYALGVTKGDWKDYSLDFNSNEAIFCFYKHTWATPDCKLSKLREKRKKRFIYKLIITNKKYSKYNDLNSLIVSLKRQQLAII
ncbi:MAG: hypothetical protein CFH15_01395 [Alphaproteobacteria bacterium MarineAlpha5_Bin5]|nr:MAG: hypothetical protein CFH15_01395 [Alphaproteobacteria bacterium MarineAlpha5_Bin5]|tara:strand:+ start:9217 stop:9546 length:330 start_codon:yes stop_codon:yes gene_type:complete